MFQNISEEYKQNSEEEIVEKKSIKDILKKFLTKQNIILYIISFMVSMVSFDDNIYPFGLAMLAATCSINAPVGVVFIITALGTLIGLGPLSLLIYIMTAVIFITLILVFKPQKNEEFEKNEKIKVGKYLVIACIVVQAVKLIATGFLWYGLLESIMFSITTYIFYKIFVNSIIVIKETGLKKVFTVEEVIGASLLLSIAFCALGELSIFEFSIRNILCILLVLILGWKNGILVGGTAGITIGVVLGIIAEGEPLLLASFALSGMIAGVLNRFGKIGVIVGFLIGNIILTYISNGNTFAIIHLKEILIASLGLLVIPKNIKIDIQDIIGKTKYLPVGKERVLEANKEAVYKLNTVSETISEIAKTYDNKEEKEETRESLEKENKDVFISDLINNISGLSENALYGDIVDPDEKIAEDIFYKLLEKEEIENNDLIRIFEKHNNYIVGIEENTELKKDIDVMVKTINYTYKISKLNFIWKKKMNQSRQNLSNELNGVSKVISTLAVDISQDTKEQYKKEKEEIQVLLEQKNIEIKDISIKQQENGKYIIKIYYDKEKKYSNKTMENILQKMFKQQIKKYKKEVQTEDNTYMQTYTSIDKFTLQVGIAKAVKNNSPVSGDSSLKTQLEDGKYLLAISDGMGSGPEAKKSSKVALKMLDRLLKDGFNKDASLALINSTMVLNSGEDMYATLDISILDLYEGNIECIKNGACATYVKNNGKVETIQAITLPAGILEKLDLVVYDKDIQDGDIIVMCSDGVTESKLDPEEKEQWLKKLLEEISTDNVQKIADIIISEAIDNGLGIAKDDMTVIVAKVTAIKQDNQ